MTAALERQQVAGRALPAALVAGSLAVCALYPISAELVHPIALPVLLAGIGLVVVSSRRPAVGVGIALLLPGLPPGYLGSLAWMAGMAWVGLLAFLLVFRFPERVRSSTAARHLPPLAVPVAFFVASMLVSFVAGGLAGDGVSIVRGTLTGVVLFLVAATALRTPRQVLDAIVGSSGAGILIGGLATLEHLAGVGSQIGFITSTGELVHRVTAGVGHPNMLGGFLVVVAPLAVAGLLADRRWRVLHALAAVLAVTGVYASYSRGAFVALAVMPLVLARGRALLLLLPAALVVVTVGVPSVMQERFATADGTGGAELASRVDIWNVGLAVWADQPWLGAGVGSFPEAYAGARVPDKAYLPDTQFQPPPHAHNLAIQALAEQGLVGFGLLAGIFVGALAATARAVRSADRRVAVVGAGGMAAIVGFLVHNVFEVTLLENTGVQVWGMLGVVSALATLERRESNPSAA